MAYSKEYYDKHKEQMKKSRDKYRSKPENKEKIKEYQRERFKNLTQEQRDEANRKRRENRAKNIKLTRLQSRIDLKRRQIKKYNEELKELDHKTFMLKMMDTWDSECYKYSDELYNQIKEINRKIDNKKREIIELQTEKDNFNFIK